MFLTQENKLRWKWMGIAAAVVVGLTLGGIFWLDAPIYLFLRRFDWGLWRYVAKVFDAKVWLMFAGVVTAVFYVNKVLRGDRPRFRGASGRLSVGTFVRDALAKVWHSYAFAVLCAVVVACAAGYVLKFVIGRGRPMFFEALDLDIFFVPFTTEWAFHSMPSGHTLATFAGLVMLGMLVPRVKAITWTVATIVGVSRVCAGAHWPTDVLVGAFVGMVAADLVKAFLKNHSVRAG